MENSSIKQIQFGKNPSIQELERYYEANCSSNNFIDYILSRISEPSIEKPFTWLLKKFVYSQKKVDKEISSRIIQLLINSSNWEAHLHLLQTLSRLTIPETMTEVLQQHLLGLRLHKNKFLRAWAYNGLYVIQTQHKKYSENNLRLLKSALTKESPSVQAKIRQLKIFL